MPHITILGSLNYDMVVYTPRMPAPGETMHSDAFETHNGGKGANQALAARRLSPPETVEVAMVGRVGQDGFGSELREGLEKAGVDVSRVEMVQGESGVAVILVERSGENRILVHGGANDTFTPEDITTSLFTAHDNTPTDYLILQNELPLAVVRRAISLASELNIKIVYNPSPMSPEILEWHDLLPSIAYLVVNESELSALIGVDLEVSSAADITSETITAGVALLYTTRGFTGTVVVTFGGHGSLFCVSGSKPVFQPPYKPASVVDTTGAGDSFLGAFVGAIASGRSEAEAIRWGAAAGCLAVQKKGAADSIPLLQDAQRLVEAST
ncbi:Ribokinase-like protein [Myxozyma melibiosi]|uniref:Ribokinase n=1 Tax=Myxozyma melibiosi TaxID=54550 RepID=A0ABR1F939_9ASCO